MINFAIQLVRRGLISPWHFVEALDAELKSRKRLGQIALEKRKLTISQVFDILNQQADDHRSFGKIAIDLGYLTEEELSLLLLSQSENAGSMIDNLVKMGVIDEATIEAEYARYYESLAEGDAPSSRSRRAPSFEYALH